MQFVSCFRRWTFKMVLLQQVGIILQIQQSTFEMVLLLTVELFLNQFHFVLLLKLSSVPEWNELRHCCLGLNFDVKMLYIFNDVSLLWLDGSSNFWFVVNLAMTDFSTKCIFSLAIFIWSIFIRAIIDHMTSNNLNWPKIMLRMQYFVFSCALDHILKR